ncbi:hypothetical protein AAG570_006020 [Ranatra chinensis]|uniref:Uncharacterized protein n=1 Tax=Ranatra chinensis TaxID=642074 RepID=A0ABD0YKG8_9HEMI
MASKRRNMFYENKKQETTEIAILLYLLWYIVSFSELVEPNRISAMFCGANKKEETTEIGTYNLPSFCKHFSRNTGYDQKAPLKMAISRKWSGSRTSDPIYFMLVALRIRVPDEFPVVPGGQVDVTADDGDLKALDAIYKVILWGSAKRNDIDDA